VTKKTDYAAEHPAEFEQGRRARLAGISEQDAPFDADTDALKAWTAGFDAAEGEAARNETMTPDDAPKAEGQIKTVAKK
jgi:hypothetical protein